jgi:hypothetical protein
VVAGTYYVSPDGTGDACSKAAPCSITQAQTTVRAAAGSASDDIVVELADGTYRLTAPLVFTEADSGNNGHKITWQAASGAHPVLSGGKQITGWAVSDSSKNIWKAEAPGKFATRQLYVDGKIAQRARVKVGRNGMSHDKDTFPLDSAVSFLNNAKQQERIELRAYCNWSDHYALVKSISGGTVTMEHTSWWNQTWGWDTITGPFFGPTATNRATYMENAYELLSEPGQWYQDIAAGALYYIPLSGQDMSKVDVELPQLEFILVVAGSSYDKKVHDLTFSGLTFSHSSWLNPNTKSYASQQTGTYINSDGKDLAPLQGSPAFPNGYPEFEATRPRWYQVPGAVQVALARNISFVRDRFICLGSAGLGIGEDDNANLGGKGLGVDTVSVTGCVFTQIAAAGLVLGGIQAPAHHPCGDAVCGPDDPATKTINKNFTISNNLIHDIGLSYADAPAINLPYVDTATVSHNEIYNTPFSGMALSWGWGTNDAGGSSEYQNRGFYKYTTKYTKPIVAKNYTITANKMYSMMKMLGDGGALYQNGALPGGKYTHNYIICNLGGPGSVGGGGQQDYFGFSADEGTRFASVTKNVFQDWYDWSTVSGTVNTVENVFNDNWYNAGQGVDGRKQAGAHSCDDANKSVCVNTCTGNIQICGATQPASCPAGTKWPADAQAIIDAAGLEPAYADLKTNP